MSCLRKYVISMAVPAMLWGAHAQADAPAPPRTAKVSPTSQVSPTAPIAPAQPLATPGPATPGAKTADASSSESPAAAEPATALSDAALVQLAQGEAIEIFDERPDKPFDRDTEVRLTGADLAARGATNLATALALIPEVSVRDAGRGGFNVDIRGGRKGAVSVLVDGVLVSDPYYGTFDVSTIPVTDIVQIRIATTPQSPLDGPGGPGGVIEVHTRDAVGSQLMIGRLLGDSLRTVGATGTGRVALSRHLALRMSASGESGRRDFDLPGDATVGERRYAATGSTRLEYRDGDRRIALDGFLDNRRYVVPPSDTARSAILLIDRETSARGSIKADDKIGSLQLQGQAWTHYLDRRSRYFADSSLSSLSETKVENLKALRSGGTALATRPFLRDFRWAVSTTVDFEKAAVSDIMNSTVRGHTTIIEAAGDLQYERHGFRADVSGGAAIPFGVDAKPWPEGKAVLKYRYDSHEVTATAAYKGRVPSLRERFDSVSGNPALGPERVAHGELRVVEHITDRLHLELAPFYKHSTGTIRASVDPMNQGQMINLGTVNFWGADTQAKLTTSRYLDIGGGYSYIKAQSIDGGVTRDDPLDRLPHHRWDAWAQVRPLAMVSALVRVKYFGSAIDQTVQVDGYATVEANVAAQIGRQYLAVLSVQDLTDEAPETRAGYHTAGRIVSLIMQGTWE